MFANSDRFQHGSSIYESFSYLNKFAISANYLNILSFNENNKAGKQKSKKFNLRFTSFVKMAASASLTHNVAMSSLATGMNGLNVEVGLKRDPRLDLWFINEEEKRDIEPRIQKCRKRLPIFEKRERIVQLIERNNVVMIKGETGCGKTTQVPQYVLEDRIEKGNGSVTNILVTQPRRISALSVASRVAEERGEIIGECSRQVSIIKIMKSEWGFI